MGKLIMLLLVLLIMFPIAVLASLFGTGGIIFDALLAVIYICMIIYTMIKNLKS